MLMVVSDISISSLHTPTNISNLSLTPLHHTSHISFLKTQADSMQKRNWPCRYLKVLIAGAVDGTIRNLH